MISVDTRRGKQHVLRNIPVTATRVTFIRLRMGWIRVNCSLKFWSFWWLGMRLKPVLKNKFVRFSSELVTLKHWNWKFQNTLIPPWRNLHLLMRVEINSRDVVNASPNSSEKVRASIHAQFSTAFFFFALSMPPPPGQGPSPKVPTLINGSVPARARFGWKSGRCSRACNLRH